ncbi:MAG: hypothetical protein HQL40_17830 [Alphaproteobacteria bacterium]|nr:hypothetical protein [Alphaproteobacteria bacterium]MBF0335476.1 hypothetical protein [Alphaproteobacteria bacterium]
MAEVIDLKAKSRKRKTAPPSAAPWSIRGVSPEARNAASLASRRSGKALGEWLEPVVMAAAHAELKGTAMPAATPGDTLAAILAQLERRDQAMQDLASKVEAMQKRGFLKRLFGG